MLHTLAVFSPRLMSLAYLCEQGEAFSELESASVLHSTPAYTPLLKRCPSPLQLTPIETSMLACTAASALFSPSPPSC